MAASATVDFLAFLLSGQCLRAATNACRVSEDDKAVRLLSELADQAQKDLGTVLDLCATSEALKCGCTEDAWEKLLECLETFQDRIAALGTSQEEKELAQRLGIEFRSSLQQLKDELGISRVDDGTLRTAIQSLLQPILVHSIEKARRFWYPTRGCPSILLPEVRVLAQPIPSAAQDPDLWAETDLFPEREKGTSRITSAVVVFVHWISAYYNRLPYPKPLLQWLCRQAVVIAHEAHHAVLLQSDRKYRSTELDNAHRLHGWFFFLTVVDALERAARRSPVSPVERVNLRCLQEMAGRDDPRLGSGGPTLEGWRDARTCFSLLTKTFDETVAYACPRRTCPYYGSVDGMTPYVAFHVLTRLNALQEMREIFPETCHAQQNEFEYENLRVNPWLCHPLKSFLTWERINIEDRRQILASLARTFPAITSQLCRR